jgi:hypothetical protein
MTSKPTNFAATATRSEDARLSPARKHHGRGRVVATSIAPAPSTARGDAAARPPVAHVEREGSAPPVALCGARMREDHRPAPPEAPRCRLCRLLFDGPTGDVRLN